MLARKWNGAIFLLVIICFLLAPDVKQIWLLWGDILILSLITIKQILLIRQYFLLARFKDLDNGEMSVAYILKLVNYNKAMTDCGKLYRFLTGCALILFAMFLFVNRNLFSV